MKNPNRKLVLNKQVISNLNAVVGGYAPTYDCTANDTVIKLTNACLTNQESACICW